MRRTLATAAVTIALASSARGAAPESCRAGYGDVVDFEHCASVILPDFVARSTGVSQPVSGLPLSCRNYEAVKGAETTPFKQCSTGVLGGGSVITLGGKRYTVVFDVGSGCARTPGGGFAPAFRGHVFLEGELDDAAWAKFTRESDDREAACFARKR